MIKEYNIFGRGRELLAAEVGGYVVAAFQSLTAPDRPYESPMLIEPGWTMRDAVRNYMAERVDDYCSSMSDDTQWINDVIAESRLTERELRWKAAGIYRSFEPRDPRSITPVELAATALMRGFEDFWPDPENDPDEDIAERMSAPLSAYRLTFTRTIVSEVEFEAPAGMGMDEAFDCARPRVGSGAEDRKRRLEVFGIQGDEAMIENNRLYVSADGVAWRRATWREELRERGEWFREFLGFVASLGREHGCAVHYCGFKFWHWWPTWLRCRFDGGAGNVASGGDLRDYLRALDAEGSGHAVCR